MVVIDASAVIEYLLDARKYPRLDEIISAQALHAPSLIDVEVLHAFRHAVLGGRLDLARANLAIEDFVGITIERHSHEHLLSRMWEIRDNITAYDAAYVALAESLEVPLLTRDRRLARSSGHAARIEYID